jgi:hypothetical protein
MVTSSRLPTTLYNFSKSFEHVIGVPYPIHYCKLPPRSVELNEWSGLCFVEIETTVHRIWCVVAALCDVAATYITDPWRRIVA